MKLSFLVVTVQCEELLNLLLGKRKEESCTFHYGVRREEQKLTLLLSKERAMESHRGEGCVRVW